MISFQTLNNAKYEIKDDIVIMEASEKSDYFVDPESFKIKANAPFIYKEVKGDFILEAKVSHDFLYVYDACCLLALSDDTLWAKACFEKSDFNTKSIVSVMTDKTSDDANGINTDSNEIWLKLSRKKDIFTVHYSYDGVNYFFSRITRIVMPDTVKVGLLAQSPLGRGGLRFFKNINLKYESLKDLRKGI